jgi:subtilisin family serine protease
MVLDEIRTAKLRQNDRDMKDSARSLETVQLDRVPRGLDRIDQVSRPLDGQYKHRLDGAGVTVFVMDSGLLTSHSEFDGQNAGCGFDAYNPVEDANDNGNVPDDDEVPPQRHCIDSVNHGTHVAGTFIRLA